MSIHHDTIDQPLYSCEPIPGPPFKMLFFANPVGSLMRGYTERGSGYEIPRTLADTNMYLENQLPEGCSFELSSIGIKITDRLIHGALQLRVASRTWFTAPLSLCRVQEPQDRGYVLTKKLIIRECTMFGVEVEWPAPPLYNGVRHAAPSAACIILYGRLTRPVC